MYSSQENNLQQCILPVGVTLLADSCLDYHLLRGRLGWLNPLIDEQAISTIDSRFHTLRFGLVWCLE